MTKYIKDFHLGQLNLHNYSWFGIFLKLVNKATNYDDGGVCDVYITSVQQKLESHQQISCSL